MLLSYFRVFGISLLIAGGFGGAIAASKDDEVLARVGQVTVTVGEFNKKYEEVKSVAVNPPTKEKFLEDYIRYKIGLQEAIKKKLDKDPIIQEHMQRELYKGLLERELSDRVAKITISEKEMQEYYKRNPEIRSSHILIEIKPDSTPAQREEARKRALEIYEEVKKSKRPFEELVKIYSDDILTKDRGGDLGFQSRATVLPNFYEAILGMKVGEIKGVIESPNGFHIVKVTDRRSYENSDKRQLKALVFDEKRAQILNEYFEKLKKEYKVEINRNTLNKAIK
ncbi:MAG: peptidylprolyl isomerase [Bdellovibrionaceae bacterium]|nr:peptidylprolyl isomerase [Pseudobdellovibrionaceae bacterium]MDW8190268.1 peptidylprolyl isomerase [Pseudobdellovibrionaceae bacterium]